MKESLIVTGWHEKLSKHVNFNLNREEQIKATSTPTPQNLVTLSINKLNHVRIWFQTSKPRKLQSEVFVYFCYHSGSVYRSDYEKLAAGLSANRLYSTSHTPNILIYVSASFSVLLHTIYIHIDSEFSCIMTFGVFSL